MNIYDSAAICAALSAKFGGEYFEATPGPGEQWEVVANGYVQRFPAAVIDGLFAVPAVEVEIEAETPVEVAPASEESPKKKKGK